MALKKRTRNILLGILIIGIIGAIYGYSEYTRKPADLAGAKPDNVVTAPQILSEYNANEKAANQKYLDKVTSVRGALKQIDKDHTGSISLALETGDPLAGVSCELDPRHTNDAEGLKTGDTVTITGTCAGMLTDVVLNRCAVTKK